MLTHRHLRHHIVRAGVAVLLAFVGTACRSAQAVYQRRLETGIEVVTLDERNRPIADATVAVLSGSGNLIGTAQTDSEGRARIANLHAAEYELSINSPPREAALQKVAVADDRLTHMTLHLGATGKPICGELKSTEPNLRALWVNAAGVGTTKGRFFTKADDRRKFCFSLPSGT